MPSPTQLSNGSICLQVSFADLLGVSGQEEDGSGTATEQVLVKWSGPATAADSEFASDGTTTVPQRGTPHRIIPSRFAKRVQVEAVQQDTLTAFWARVEYSDAYTTLLDPTTAPPVVNWDFAEAGQEPYFLDNDPAGPKPVVNKAGEPFTDYLERATGEVVVSYARNVKLADVAALRSYGVQYTNATPPAGGNPCPVVNSDAFTIDGQAVAAGQARFRGLTIGDQQVDNGVKYRVVKTTLALRATFNQVVDNRGFNEKATVTIYQQEADAGGNSVQVTAQRLREIAKGQPPVKPDHPWPLRDDGTAMDNATDKPTSITFYPYPKKPFAVFSFA